MPPVEPCGLLFDVAVSIELADIGPEVIDLLLILHAGKYHFGARDFGPGIFYIVLETRFVPNDSGVFVCIGIAEIRNRTGFAAVDPVELGADLILRAGADRVADHALVEHGFALFGILRQTYRRRCRDHCDSDGQPFQHVTSLLGRWPRLTRKRIFVQHPDCTILARRVRYSSHLFSQD